MPNSAACPFTSCAPTPSARWSSPWRRCSTCPPNRPMRYLGRCHQPHPGRHRGGAERPALGGSAPRLGRRPPHAARDGAPGPAGLAFLRQRTQPPRAHFPRIKRRRWHLVLACRPTHVNHFWSLACSSPSKAPKAAENLAVARRWPSFCASRGMPCSPPASRAAPRSATRCARC